MNKRRYNVFYNTHTISGIVISVALFIIFFAGAFSIFRHEIDVWETGKAVSHQEKHQIDYDNLFEILDEEYDLHGRDLQINFGDKADKIYVFMSASKDSLASEKAKESHFFAVDNSSGETKLYQEYYNLSEFLYRLHFFHQIPVVGIYIAGLVSFFFLFAIITGVIVHWKKIISNFYYFNPKGVLKRVWGDAHTALGILGLPFQFIYAVSGAYFALSILVLIPANFLYNGDQEKLLEDMRPSRKAVVWDGPATVGQATLGFNHYANETYKEWKNFNLTRGFVRNYGGKNMKYIIMGEKETDDRFVGLGTIKYDAYSGEKETVKSPETSSYVEDSQLVMGRVHFANFGGYPVKFIYFSLALISCFVIISGVLLYVEARNKKSSTDKQRRFTANVGHIYMSICLSMLPVTAIAFIFSKCTNGMFNNNMLSMYAFYFPVWIAWILFLRYKRDNYLVNKITLFCTTILGFLIPIFNGIISGNWLWQTYQTAQFEIFMIDLLWILIAISCLLFYLGLNPKIKEQSSFSRFPLKRK